MQRFVSVDKSDKKKTKNIIVTWPGKFGPTWAFDGRLTEEELVAAYRESKRGATYGNVYTDKPKGGDDFAAPKAAPQEDDEPGEWT